MTPCRVSAELTAYNLACEQAAAASSRCEECGGRLTQDEMDCELLCFGCRNPCEWTAEGEPACRQGAVRGGEGSYCIAHELESWREALVNELAEAGATPNWFQTRMIQVCRAQVDVWAAKMEAA